MAVWIYGKQVRLKVEAKIELQREISQIGLQVVYRLPDQFQAVKDPYLDSFSEPDLSDGLSDGHRSILRPFKKVGICTHNAITDF